MLVCFKKIEIKLYNAHNKQQSLTAHNCHIFQCKNSYSYNNLHTVHSSAHTVYKKHLITYVTENYQQLYNK